MKVVFFFFFFFLQSYFCSQSLFVFSSGSRKVLCNFSFSDLEDSKCLGGGACSLIGSVALGFVMICREGVVDLGAGWGLKKGWWGEPGRSSNGWLRTRKSHRGGACKAQFYMSLNLGIKSRNTALV